MATRGGPYSCIGVVLAVVLPALTFVVGLLSTRATATLEPFSSDNVATVRIVMADDDWDRTRDNARLEQYVCADFWCDGELVPGVGVRPKGNSSLDLVVRSGSQRLSLKVDFNLFNTARTFRGVKKVNLNNGFRDASLMKEVLAYDLYRNMGVPVPRTTFVDLWVNDTHLGLYTMVEQIDKAFLSRHFDDARGNLYKPSAPGAFLRWTSQDAETPDAEVQAHAEYGDVNVGGGKLEEIERALQRQELAGLLMRPQSIPKVGVDAPAHADQGATRDGEENYVASMGLKTNENAPDHSALFRFLEVLNSEPDVTFAQEIEKVLDVDETLRWLAVSSAMVHLDNYTGTFGHNYYLYESGGRFTILPWDLNGSFGGFSLGMSRGNLFDFPIDEPTMGRVQDRPLVYRLLAQPAYLETYHGYLRELIEGPFSPEAMNVEIERVAAMIRPYVAVDDLKFNSTEEFERMLVDEATARPQAGRMLHDISLVAFVRLRTESILRQLEGARPNELPGESSRDWSVDGGLASGEAGTLARNESVLGATVERMST